MENCFFRCISKAVTGTEKCHSYFREAICIVEKQQSEDFFQQVDGPLATHINDMRRPGAWATTAEIFAAGNLMVATIYVYSVFGSRWVWQRHAPLQGNETDTFVGLCII